MKKSIISEAQIVKALKEYEGGRDHGQICRELGIHKSTFYNWRKKYAGMDSQEPQTAKGTGGREPPAQTHVCGTGAG